MNIVIIEDEKIAVDRLLNILNKQNIQFNLLAQPDSIKSSIEFFENTKEQIDLVFMDINLSDGQSFEIFKSVKLDAYIIFITAFDEYALKAFETNSIDYLLKPIKEIDLVRAYHKYLKIKSSSTSIVNPSYSDLFAKQSRIVVRYGSVIKAIEIKEAAYFFTSQKVTFMVLKNSEKYPIDETLDELEDMLNAKEYFRINRQYIVSFQSIESMSAYTKSRVKIILKPLAEEETIVSTERSSDFKKWLLGK